MPRRRRIAVAALVVHRDIYTIEDTFPAREAGVEDLPIVNILSYNIVKIYSQVKTGDSKS